MLGMAGLLAMHWVARLSHQGGCSKPLAVFMVRQAHHERRCEGTSNRSP